MTREQKRRIAAALVALERFPGGSPLTIETAAAVEMRRIEDGDWDSRAAYHAKLGPKGEPLSAADRWERALETLAKLTGRGRK